MTRIKVILFRRQQSDYSQFKKRRPEIARIVRFIKGRNSICRDSKIGSWPKNSRTNALLACNNDNVTNALESKHVRVD